MGSVVALTDSRGIPAAAYAYDPWGNALLTIPDAVGTRNKFRFTGEALDPGTGLYFFRQRYYDSASGRFFSADPYPGSRLVPLTRNRYPYALNNALRLRDPSGLTAIDGSNQNLTANIASSVGDNLTQLITLATNTAVSIATLLAQIGVHGPNSAVSPSGASAAFNAETVLFQVLVAGLPVQVYLAQQQLASIEQNYSIVADPRIMASDIPQAIFQYVRHDTNYFSGLSDEVIKGLLVQVAIEHHVHPLPQWLH